MSPPLSHDDMAEMVAAYALDAVDGAEGVAVEAHLATCAECRDLLDEHRETAAMLAELAGTETPPSFDRLAAAIDEPPPPLQMTHRSRRRPVLLAAAAAVVVALGAGILIGHAVASSPSRPSTLSQLADAAGRSSGARAVTLTDTAGDPKMKVVLTSSGQAYVTRSRLSAVGDDRTYQLWAVVDGAAISVGLLGPNPGVSQFRVPARAAALAVTEEVAGGVVKTTQTPVASASLA